MKTIEVENIGPVSRLSIPVPESGGLVVFRGRNGAGKSHVLQAIDTLVSGRGRVAVKDGELRGAVHGLGVTLTVARSQRRTGELEVLSLDGRLSVADLIEPGIANPEAADAKRIKALVQLSGQGADPALFYHLVGGQADLEAIVDAKALDGDDVVAMAARIKRSLEAAARTAEGEASHATVHAQAAREAADGVDVTVETSAEVLAVALEDAIRFESKIKTDAANAAMIVQQAAAAQRSIDAAGDGRVSIDEAESAVANAQSELDAANAAVRVIENNLAAAKRDAELKLSRLVSLEVVLDAARRHENTLAAWRESIDAAAGVGLIPEEALEAAQAAVQAARLAVEQGALARAAILQQCKAEAAADLAKDCTARATRLRDAARGTDDVLSGLVAKSGAQLKVEAGRLVLTTGRGKTYYGDLSDGERTLIGLDIAIDAVGPMGELTIPQAFWEALDPINKQKVAERVQGRGVLFFTAEATGDEELTATVYGANGH